MKSSTFLFIFLLILITDATAQIDTADFFPMQKGNHWLYSCQRLIGCDYMEMTVLGDTLMPNGKRYARFHQNLILTKRGTLDYKDWYFRKCLNNVYIFDDSLGEYKYFDLSPDIASGTIWETYRDPQNKYILGKQVYLILRSDTLDWLPDIKFVRSFGDVQIDPATNEAVQEMWSEMHSSLLKGIGLVRTDITGGPSFPIRGAIINGVKLGDTTIGPTLSSVKTEKNIAPGSISVQAYPNPFNSTTRLNVQLKSAGMTELIVFNALGQKAATIFEGYKPSGSFTFSFNADHLTSGIYFVTLKQGGFFSKEKIVLLK